MATLGAPLEATLLLAAADRLTQVLELTVLRRRCIEEAPAALQQAAAAAAVAAAAVAILEGATIAEGCGFVFGLSIPDDCEGGG